MLDCSCSTNQILLSLQVTPISYLTNGELSKASQRLISKHEETYLTQERPIMQVGYLMNGI